MKTEAQLGRLRDEGCTEVQGYYFSPPRPAGAEGYRYAIFLASFDQLSFRGASEASEPGIHNHHREYGFRACACGASRNDGPVSELDYQAACADLPSPAPNFSSSAATSDAGRGGLK